MSYAPTIGRSGTPATVHATTGGEWACTTAAQSGREASSAVWIGSSEGSDIGGSSGCRFPSRSTSAMSSGVVNGHAVLARAARTHEEVPVVDAQADVAEGRFDEPLDREHPARERDEPPLGRMGNGHGVVSSG